MTNLLHLKKMGDGSPRGRGLANGIEVACLRSGVRQEILLDVVAVGLEQHACAAKLTNLLLGPLDHAVALAALGVHHFAGGSHLEALFSARLGLQLGHLALLLPQHESAREGIRSAEMLVRALKVLDYLVSETIGTGIDTAALDQPGDEVALMAEPSQIGNDERWNRNAPMHHLTPSAAQP